VTRNNRQQLTVEKLGDDYLDAGELRRWGIYQDRWITVQPFLRWPGIARMRVAKFLILLEMQNQATRQRIPVSWTRCRYGGTRPWLICQCGRRVLRLFKALPGYYCRQCFDNARYASQCKSLQGRLHFQACKLRLRLGGVASLTAPFPERPRGMHRRTFERLRRRAELLESGLSNRVKTKPADYPNLVYYSRPSII